MKRRYSNFHRARKYFRKWLRRNRRDHLVDAGYFRDLYEKYDMWAYLHDGVNSGHENVGEDLNERLVILAHFDPLEATTWLSCELKYQPVADLKEMSSFINSCKESASLPLGVTMSFQGNKDQEEVSKFVDDCHTFALNSLGITKEKLEDLTNDR